MLRKHFKKSNKTEKQKRLRLPRLRRRTSGRTKNWWRKRFNRMCGTSASQAPELLRKLLPR
jgi:hypothetical protein